MLSKYSRLKFRRKFRARKKKFQNKAEDANKQLERHLFRRDHNWKFARRFVIGWVSLVVLLAFGVTLQLRGLGDTYLEIQPTSGGVYSEGIVGNLKNANPLYATTNVDSAVTRLVFSSLLTYGEQNRLVGDIAKSWKSDESEKVYTVELRDNVFWHDGEKLDADDVVFTYQAIKNPDTQSNLYLSWRPVKIKKIDDFTVEFTLPNAYSPFPHLLTNGILPQHVLSGVEDIELRGSNFNSKPIGSGPFKLENVNVTKTEDGTTENIQLVKNEQYHLGEVQLNGFNIQTYNSLEDMQKDFDSKEIIAAASSNYIQSDKVALESKLYTQSSQLMLFLNTQKDATKDKNLRQALIKATNVNQISQKLPYSVIAVDQPILKGEVGYNKEYSQLAHKPSEVNKLLTDAGWKWTEGDQYRQKDGKQLTLQLVSENTPDYSAFSEEIQNQWAQFGIKTEVLLVDVQDINQQLDNKEYDVLLYSINIGADPDVYPYWHSSQTGAGTSERNLSRYESSTVDAALEAGRSRSDAKLRTAKYEPFLKAWRADVPAIGIHQPAFIYSTNEQVYNQKAHVINTPSDRYQNVVNWQINTKKNVVNR